MHIRLLYKKVLYVFLSLAIVIAPTIQQANAASSWGITKAVSSGARVIVNATNSGYKSAINISPTAGRVGARILRGANTAAWLYAAIQIANDGIDFVLEPENNRVRYKDPKKDNSLYWSDLHGSSLTAASPSEIASTSCSSIGGTLVRASDISYDCLTRAGELRTFKISKRAGSYTYDYIPVPVLAEKILKNAAAYHGASQTAVRETATEMVIAGDFDADLMSGAVPISDNKPLVPSVPGTSPNNNGDVTTGTDPGNESMSPGQTAADAAAARDAAKAASDAAMQAAKDAAADARKAADDAKDLINQAVDQAIKDLAAQAAKDAAAAAQAAKDTANAAAIAAAEAAKTAAEAASAASAQAAKDLAAAQAANDAAAIAAAEAAKAAAEAALADAKAKQEAAEKAAEKAKAEAAKPFELPAFCTWASVVCDYTVWVKQEYSKAKDWVKEEPVTTPAEMMPIDDDPTGIGNIFQDKAEAGYVSFESSCPADVLIPVDLMGASQTLTISYTPFCHFASLIRYAVILGAWISGLLIVTGGRSRE